MLPTLTATLCFLLGVARTATRASESQLFREIIGPALISILTSVMVMLALSAFIARMTRKILKAIKLQPKEDSALLFIRISGAKSRGHVVFNALKQS